MPIKTWPPIPRTAAQQIWNAGAGVSASTLAYLFAHPDLNDFMTSLKAMSREQVASKVKDYMASHPDEQGRYDWHPPAPRRHQDQCGAPPSP
jgi:heme-binding protein